MALSKEGKVKAIEEYTAKIKEAKAMFIVAPKGVTPNEATTFKKSLYENEASFNVVKNSLFRIALKNSNVGLEIGEGENAVVFSGDKISEVAKLISNFLGDTQKVEIKAGMIEGQVIDAEGVKALASLPSREVLIAQVLATMQAPVSGFVRVLNGNLSGFVNVVNAIKNQKTA